MEILTTTLEHTYGSKVTISGGLFLKKKKAATNDYFAFLDVFRRSGKDFHFRRYAFFRIFTKSRAASWKTKIEF